MKEGNQDAFAALFKLYYPELKAYGLKISGSTEIAQEGIQQLFLKIWEKKQRLNTVQNPKAYLLKAYRSTLLDLLSSEKKRNAQLTDLSFQLTYQEFSSFQDSSTNESLPIYQLVNQLSDKQREIIFLKFYNDLSYQEIAEIVGINYQTVRNYMVKAIGVLRKKMKIKSKK